MLDHGPSLSWWCGMSGNVVLFLSGRFPAMGFHDAISASDRLYVLNEDILIILKKKKKKLF